LEAKLKKRVVQAASMKTLTKMLEDAGQLDVPERSLLLKIDTEGAEWTFFAEEPVENLKKFRQILVEFHWIGLAHNTAKRELYDKALKKIAIAGFAMTHMHGCNAHGMVNFPGNYTIPDILEVSYIQKPEKCTENIPYRLPQDAVVDQRKHELPEPVLPKPKNV